MADMNETTQTENTQTLPPYPSYADPAVTRPTDPWMPPTPPPVADRSPAQDKPRRGVTLLVAVALAAGLVGGGAGAAVTAALDDQPAAVNALDQRTNASTDTAAAPAGSVEAWCSVPTG
jgi:hypothetical protein